MECLRAELVHSQYRVPFRIKGCTVVRLCSCGLAQSVLYSETVEPTKIIV